MFDQETVIFYVTVICSFLAITCSLVAVYYTWRASRTWKFVEKMRRERGREDTDGS